MSTIGFIGGGNMAEALWKGILEAGLYRPEDIWISDVRPQRLDQVQKQYRIHTTADNRELVSRAEGIVLSVKPQQMASVLEEIAGAVKADAVVISIAAGIRTEKIRAALPKAQVIRVMPNTPAMVGAGASGLYSSNAGPVNLKKAAAIFSAVGKVIVVDDEDLIDAVTAVSGSGPAYFFLLMEQMIAAGIELGLDAQAAKTLVLQTAKGAALLAEQGDQKGESPVDLRKKVTSPGGTTEAAIKVFAAEGFESMVKKALKAAFKRGQELSGRT